MPVPVVKNPWTLHLERCEEGLLRWIDPYSVSLIVADAPYNQGMEYSGHNDNMPAAQYWAWTEAWLRAAHTVLAPHGSLFLFYPDEWVSEVDVFCRKELKLHRRNMIEWIFTFGQAARKSFTRSHIHILYYVKTASNFTYHADAARVPSARQLVYGDKRAKAGGKQPDDTWVLLKQDLELFLPEAGDVWLENRVCGTYRARQKHAPNQIPVPLLERIIKVASDEGDLVCDPFVGTGSTGVAALHLRRRFVGFDVSSLCLEESNKRLQAVQAGVENGESPNLFPVLDQPQLKG